jgi:hypothetical protein
MAGFFFRLELEDGTPADPPVLHTAVPNWSAWRHDPAGACEKCSPRGADPSGSGWVAGARSLRWIASYLNLDRLPKAVRPPTDNGRENRMAFTFKLDLDDGTPADPPVLHPAVPTWQAGDNIPLGPDGRSASSKPGLAEIPRRSRCL